MASFRSMVKHGRQTLVAVQCGNEFRLGAHSEKAGLTLFNKAYPDLPAAQQAGRNKFGTLPNLLEKNNKPDYMGYTLEKLRPLAKEKGIKGYARLKKAELVAALNAA